MSKLFLRSVAVTACAWLSGCGMFSGSGDDSSVAAGDAVQGPDVLTSECARLKPLFSPGAKDLTREEMDLALQAEFKKWDKNGDGVLSEGELDPLNDALRAQNDGASPVTDWNGDGHVDYKEFVNGWHTMFELCDTNGDKKVSLRELGFSPNVVPPREDPKKPPEGASQPSRNNGGT